MGEKGVGIEFTFRVCLTSYQQLRSYGEGAKVKFHPTDWRSQGLNLQSLVYKASCLHYTPSNVVQPTFLEMV